MGLTCAGDREAAHELEAKGQEHIQFAQQARQQANQAAFIGSNLTNLCRMTVRPTILHPVLASQLCLMSVHASISSSRSPCLCCGSLKEASHQLLLASRHKIPKIRLLGAYLQVTACDKAGESIA